MKIFLLFVLSICAQLAYSQIPKVTKTYYDNLGVITEKENAKYYVVDSVWESETSSYSYYLNPESPRYIQVRGDKEKGSMRITYYRSGKVESRGGYVFGFPCGIVVYTYENGKAMGEVEFPEK